MKMFVYDFETTGLPLFDQPSEDPRQPHIVQAAAVLLDIDTRKTLASLDLIASPDGWTIPDDVAAIHGISTETASRLGIPEKLIVDSMFQLWMNSDCRLAHNQSFDARIMRIALKRFEHGDEIADAWKAAKAECTCNMATEIMKIPATEAMVATGRGNKVKRANLTEAYEHFTGKKMENAHTAMADVLACIEVYFAIQDLKKVA